MGRAEERPDDSGAPRMVLGTAGHIDHGKTTLIHALTGVDTDRLPEEKARGITIELGFAFLDLPSDDSEPTLRLAIVDVPGHEKLVRTMVSGAAGVDLVLLVVAADEGVMPQTREHVAICDLLGIERGIVALTKSDLVDAEMLDLAAEEVRDLLSGTGLADAPIQPVSAETREGLDALSGQLRALVESAPPRTPRQGPKRLSIDRAFAMRGFGTVVTGTLLGDAFEIGESVVIEPRGLEARIRSLQRHGEKVDRIEPGARCAINLQGVEVAELSRGDVVASRDSLVSTRSADLDLFWLPGAYESEGATSIEFLSGTAERRGKISPIGRESFEPGSRGYARLHIEGDPVLLVPGDRFIARGFARSDAAGRTLGGGVVLDVAPPHRRHNDPALLDELEIFAAADPLAGLRARIHRTGLTGVRVADVRREMGLTRPALEALLETLTADASSIAAGGERWLSREAVTRMEDRLEAALEKFHAEEPLRPGMSKSTLRGKLPENVRSESAECAMGHLVAAGRIAIEGEFARLIDHLPTLDPDAEASVAEILAEARRTALEPPSMKDWIERLAVTQERFRDLVAHLERQNELIRAPGDLWFARAAVEELESRVRAHFESHDELDTPTYKELIGTTRRTAMPLMELLDDLHVTRRLGEVRVQRGG